MKIKLVKLSSSFTFEVTEETQDGTRTLRLLATLHDDTRVLSFRGPDGVWAEKNANPQRRYLNTLKLADIKRMPFLKSAEALVKARVVQLREEYEIDHSMYEARREVYEHTREALCRHCKAPWAKGKRSCTCPP